MSSIIAEYTLVPVSEILVPSFQRLPQDAHKGFKTKRFDPWEAKAINLYRWKGKYYVIDGLQRITFAKRDGVSHILSVIKDADPESKQAIIDFMALNRGAVVVKPEELSWALSGKNAIDQIADAHHAFKFPQSGRYTGIVPAVMEYVGIAPRTIPADLEVASDLTDDQRAMLSDVVEVAEFLTSNNKKLDRARLIGLSAVKAAGMDYRLSQKINWDVLGKLHQLTKTGQGGGFRVDYLTAYVEGFRMKIKEGSIGPRKGSLQW